VNIYVNDEGIRFVVELDAPVGEGDTLKVLWQGGPQ
jgi:molybdopterin converting factor small subunit